MIENKEDQLPQAQIAQQVQNEIFGKMPAAIKVQLAFEMRDLAWQIKTRALKAQHPLESDEQIFKRVKRIFLYART